MFASTTVRRERKPALVAIRTEMPIECVPTPVVLPSEANIGTVVILLLPDALRLQYVLFEPHYIYVWHLNL